MLTFGCGGPQETPTPTGGDRSPREHPPADAGPTVPETYFLQADATGATEEAAYAAAVDRLEASLLGDDAWVSTLDVVAHDPTQDPMRRDADAGGQVRVVVGLERDRVVSLLAGIEELPLEAPVPSLLAEPVGELHRVRLSGLVCRRRQALLDEPCPSPPDADVASRMRELSRTVRLQPAYPDGVPLDASLRPLRPIVVRAEHAVHEAEWVPLPGLPVELAQPEGMGAVDATRAETDGDGLARFNVAAGTSWVEGVRVIVDGDRFHGPLADLWPAQELPIVGRRTSLRRWCLAATVRVQGQAASPQHVTASLQQELGRLGAKAMVTLPNDVTQRLRSEAPAKLAASLPALADTWAGRVDVLVRVDLDSEFASPMGAHRMWYEARGRVEAYDVWTGRQLTTQQATVTAEGVGDDRADRAAQSRFAAQVAEQLVAALPLGP